MSHTRNKRIHLKAGSPSSRREVEVPNNLNVELYAAEFRRQTWMSTPGNFDPKIRL